MGLGKSRASLAGNVGNTSDRGEGKRAATVPQQLDLLESAESRRELKPLEWRVRVHRLARNLSLYESDLEAAARLLRNGESPRDETLPVAEHAAYTLMAQTVLNLDELITLE